MIPKFSTDGTQQAQQYKTKTYRIDFDNKRIVGTVDGLNAMTQAVRKIMMTERYSERIYSGDYGVEFQQFIGASVPFVENNLSLVLSDAFQSDARITSVDEISVNRIDCDGLVAEFKVETDSGEILTNANIEV